ncbi:MAG: Succinyl-diaminopimelate desuccinylase [Rhodocyclaceae bacterium]|nr:MAG: M20 family peptidase [Rhodocyclaceae bacterium]MBV6409180.1 Succinyl-diaminopimelate desuccinylase [Rhodocyclaceae bacterium]CAG0945642.1 carboxypeptidase PM20D1 [Gammaproteobacteria bacterium]
MPKKISLLALALLAALAAVIAANALRQTSRQLDVAPAPQLAVDEQSAARRLAAAVRLRTISHDGQPDASAAEFRKLHALLKKSFPRAHAVLKRETVNELSLLYTWPGSDPAARPIMLMAHQDVVPIAPGTERDWQADPFGGEIRDGFVWGRGAWDDKANLFALFEAVEMLATAGFQPRQTVYIASGHDEEVGGERGAKAIAGLLKARGVKLDFVVDEGLLITEGILKGLDRPVALIGTAEKGYLTLALAAKARPGHSSMPPPETAIGMLSAALVRLEDRQMPAAIRGVAAEMFDTIAPETSGVNRVLLSNLWLFGPLVKHQLVKAASTNAMLRTTTSLTVVKAGNKENVLPGQAEALVNFRILPGDSVGGVKAHVRTTVANETITVASSGQVSEPTPISPSAAPSYRLIARTVRELFPGTIVAPGLMLGATDSRHMVPIADAIFRFSPVRAKSEDLPRFHGTNERISVANHAELIRFYHRLLHNAAEKTEEMK